MHYIDFHCDTLGFSYNTKHEDIYDFPEAMLDLKRLKAGGCLAQFFAIFMPAENCDARKDGQPFNDADYIAWCFKVYKKAMKEHGDIIGPVFSLADFDRNCANGKMSAFLTFEDGRPVEGSFEKLEAWYNEGIRLITLTWNGENCFGFPNSDDPEIMQKGLKPFGKEAIARMNELGIIIDVSHLSDGGFRDVAALSKKPFIASHSNCRAISPHRRNLTDEMIKTLAEKGGVAGLNYCPAFLNADTASEDSTLEMMSAHIRRMIDLGGVEFPALGSDFDGIGGKLEVPSADKVPLIFDRLKRDGLSEEAIEKIAWKNADRVIREVMK